MKLRIAVVICMAVSGTAAASGPSERERPPTTAAGAWSRRNRPTGVGPILTTRSIWNYPAAGSIIELAPRFAPQHVANIKALVAERYFDGLRGVRVQDNFVAQWGDTDKVRLTQKRHAQAAR